MAPHLGVTGLSDDWIELDQQLNDRNGVWKRFICPDTDALERGKYTEDPADANISKQGTMMVCAVGGSEVTAWSTNTDYAFNEGVFGFHYDVRYMNRRLRGHTALFSRASELALFTDANPRAAWSTSFFEPGWITWTPSLTATGAATLGDALAGNGKVDSKDMFDLNRHGKRISIGFADGHVECLTLDQPTLDRVYLVVP